MTLPRGRPALALGAAGLLLALVAWQAWSDGLLWRRAYPYLPRQVQGLPYRLRAALPRREQTPVPLPTAPAAAPPTRLIEAPGTASPAPTEAAASATPAVDLPASTRIGGLTHAFQTWNNCGPATASMALSAFGSAPDQARIAATLKPDPEDKNVSPEEIVAFVRSLDGMGALWRQGGDRQRLKTLLAAGVPVIVETWFVPEPGDEMGHYRVLTGFEDGATDADDEGYFLAHDSFLGPDRRLGYRSFDEAWRAFNRGFMPVYPLARQTELGSLLGPLADDRSMALAALAAAQAEAAERGDAFAWFNLGTSLLAAGDVAGAATAYDRARAIGLPWRMLWYQFGPFEAYAALGRWQDVSALAEANLRNAPNLEESVYWLGRAAAARGDLETAAAGFRRALRLNPGFLPAGTALAGLDQAPSGP